MVKINLTVFQKAIGLISNRFLNGEISNKEMQEMNYEVNVKKESAAKVAHRNLVQHQLLKEAKS